MGRRKQSQYSDDAGDAAKAAKVTLVKPLQDDAGESEAMPAGAKETSQEAEKPSYESSIPDIAALAPLPEPQDEPNLMALPRPKFGRAPSRMPEEKPALAAPEPTPLLESPPSPAYAPPYETLAEGDLPQGHHLHRSWDTKFALFLGALFVIINFGLISLLHHDHHGTKPAQQPTSGKPAVVAAVPAPAPAYAVPATQAARPAAPAQVAVSRSAPKAPVVASVKSAGPVVTGVMVSAPKLSPSAGTNPARPVAAKPVIATAHPAVTPAAAPATAVKPAPQVAASQQLLAILNKY